MIRNTACGGVRGGVFFFVLGLKANMLVDKTDKHHLCVFAAILSPKILNKKKLRLIYVVRGLQSKVTEGHTALKINYLLNGTLIW